MAPGSCRGAVEGLGEPIYCGAEAALYIVEWFWGPALAKVRLPKPYRHPLLDERHRRRRVGVEARAVLAALEAGVDTPAIYYVDPLNTVIVMEYLGGAKPLAALIEQGAAGVEELVEAVGSAAARLHEAGIAHGDLTTSNILVSRGHVYFIDFGLADLHADELSKAVDLHLFLRSLESIHPDVVEPLYEAFLRGYAAVAGRERAESLREAVRQIRLMGRYREERRTAWSG
jgi:TP53 regulating kinase-like protein